MDEQQSNLIVYPGCLWNEGQYNSEFSIEKILSPESLFFLILESRSGTGENARNPDYLPNLKIILQRLSKNFFEITSIQNASSSTNIAERNETENILFFDKIPYPIDLKGLNIEDFATKITTALRQNGNTQSAGTTHGRVLIKVKNSNNIKQSDFEDLVLYENLNLIRPLIDQIKKKTIQVDTIERKPLLEYSLKKEISEKWPHQTRICNGYVAFYTQTGLIERTTDADLINYASCVPLYDELFKYSDLAKEVFSKIKLESGICQKIGEKNYTVNDDVKNKVIECVEGFNFLNRSSKSLLIRFIVDNYDSRKNDLGPYKGINRDDCFSPVAAEATIARKDNSIRNDLIKLYIENRALAQNLVSGITKKNFKIGQDSFDISTEFKTSCQSSKLNYEQKLVDRFASSLLAKPFLILSGLSGSGKTKLAQAFAAWICESTEQFQIISVGADWTNKEHLLGYFDSINEKYVTQPALSLILRAQKKENENKPYFLILDEMNLSHVERYFSDFLSVLESGGDIHLHDSKEVEDNHAIPQKIIQLPENLFIIGTVNMDETTYVFSPKVLDRANVIEFRVNEEEFDKFIESPQKVDLTKLEKEGTVFASNFLNFSKQKEFAENKNIEKLKSELKVLFKVFQNNGWDFGYRVGYEITRYFDFYTLISEDKKWEAALDAQIVQKLMPKLNGSASRLGGILKSLSLFCSENPEDSEEKDKANIIEEKIQSTAAINPVQLYLENKDETSFPLTFEKTYRMWRAAQANGFTSFSEN